MQTARYACPNEFVWQELSSVTWRFKARKNVDVAFENATTRRSHGSPHTMDLSVDLGFSAMTVTRQLRVGSGYQPFTGYRRMSFGLACDLI